MAETQPITMLLQEFFRWGQAALDRLMPFVYASSEACQRFLRRESSGHTLQPTALVHEHTPDWWASSSLV